MVIQGAAAPIGAFIYQAQEIFSFLGWNEKNRLDDKHVILACKSIIETHVKFFCLLPSVVIQCLLSLFC